MARNRVRNVLLSTAESSASSISQVPGRDGRMKSRSTSVAWYLKVGGPSLIFNIPRRS
jgi:hypothetical protein